MCAMLAILGAVLTLAIAPLVSAIPAAASAVASASPSASGTANATASCIIASPGEACAFNMYGESDTACNSDLVSTLFCDTNGLWTVDQACGSLELCQCAGGLSLCA